MPLIRVLLPVLLGMVAAAPAAHVDVQVERPSPDEPGKTREETISITFRAVDYRPAWDSELRVELENDSADTDGTGSSNDTADDNDPQPRPPLRERALAPCPAPVHGAAPRRTELRAGRLALPPPARRA